MYIVIGGTMGLGNFSCRVIDQTGVAHFIKVSLSSPSYCGAARFLGGGETVASPSVCLGSISPPSVRI